MAQARGLQLLRVHEEAAVTAALRMQERNERDSGASPDLMISDIKMPMEDGYVFVRRLRAMEDGLGHHLLRSRSPPTPATRIPAVRSRSASTAPLEAVDPVRLVEIVASLVVGVRRSPETAAGPAGP